jgi:hypothetical protein
VNGLGPSGPTLPSLPGGLFFGAIFSLIFLISINFVEYKTGVSNRPYLKIILFSVLFWLATTLLVGFFWGSIINFLGGSILGEQSFVILILMLYTPIITSIVFILFSLIPSLVFIKIKDNKKIQKVLLYGTIALILVIIILIPIATYQYNLTDWTVH